MMKLNKILVQIMLKNFRDIRISSENRYRQFHGGPVVRASLALTAQGMGSVPGR